MDNYRFIESSGVIKYSTRQYRPLGGYVNRQISFLLNNFTFSKEGEDKDNEGLLIPRYAATGRTAPNGKVYPAVQVEDENKLVPVRSIVKKRTGNVNVITPDLLSKRFLTASFPDGSAIGLSAGTSFSESTTQSILGLKLSLRLNYRNAGSIII